MITIIKGFLIGIANIIPGVSGGTLALVLGIYRRTIRAIHNIDARLVGAFLRYVAFRKGAGKQLLDELQRMDAWFLARLGIGAVVAILTLSHLMEYLLRNHHAPAYG